MPAVADPGDVQSTTSIVRPHRSRRGASSATTVSAVGDPGDVQSMTSLGRAHRSRRAATTAVLGSASAAKDLMLTVTVWTWSLPMNWMCNYILFLAHPVYVQIISISFSPTTMKLAS